MPPLRRGLLFSFLCAVAAVANAQNAGEQAAVVYSVTFGCKGDRCTRLSLRLPGKLARDPDRNT